MQLMKTAVYLVKRLALLNQFLASEFESLLVMSIPSHKGFFATLKMAFYLKTAFGCLHLQLDYIFGSSKVEHTSGGG